MDLKEKLKEKLKQRISLQRKAFGMYLKRFSSFILLIGTILRKLLSSKM